MFKISLLTIALLTIPIFLFAGAIVVGTCSNCGYNTDELFIGGGMMPGLIKYIYYSPDRDEYLAVGFNLIHIFCEENDLDLSYTKDYEGFIGEYRDEFSEFELKWTPPDEIETDDVPGWVNISIKSEMNMPEKLILCKGDVWEDEFTCPDCNEVTLTFERIGLWD